MSTGSIRSPDVSSVAGCADLTGRFMVRVVQAEGLYEDAAETPGLKFEPFVVAKIGNQAMARYGVQHPCRCC